MIFLICLAIIFSFVCMGHIFLRWFKPYRKFSCKIGWHSYPKFDNIRYITGDPYQVLTFAKCQWCGYEGQIDSQGNLF